MDIRRQTVLKSSLGAFLASRTEADTSAETAAEPEGMIHIPEGRLKGGCSQDWLPHFYAVSRPGMRRPRPRLQTISTRLPFKFRSKRCFNPI